MADLRRRLPKVANRGPDWTESGCLRRRPGWFDCRLPPGPSRLPSHSCLDPGDQPGGFLKDVKPEKLPPEVLEREINRLAAISGVQLRMNAVGLNSEEYDLTIVDRTAYQPGSEEALAVDGIGERWRPIGWTLRLRKASFRLQSRSRGSRRGLGS